MSEKMATAWRWGKEVGMAVVLAVACFHAWEHLSHLDATALSGASLMAIATSARDALAEQYGFEVTWQ